MVLYIDADACPVTRQALSLARRHRVPAVLVGNQTQNLQRFKGKPDVEIVEVASGPDSADFAIVQRVRAGDVVITQDVGLAAMVIGRGARPVSPRGHLYSPDTIDAELAVRHAEQVVRRAGGRTRGPSTFTEEDRARFAAALEKLLTGAT